MAPLPISGTMDRIPSVWDAPPAPSSEPTSPTHTASSSGWFISPSPKGHPSLLWVLRNFLALEGRACLASSPRNQLLDQLHWQNCNCSFRVLPISANGLSLAQAKTWEPPLALPLTPHILSVSKSCCSAFTCPESSLTGTPVPVAAGPPGWFPYLCPPVYSRQLAQSSQNPSQSTSELSTDFHLTLLLPPRPDTLALLVPPLSPHLPLFLLTCYAQLSRADRPKAPRACSSLRLLP